MPPEDDVIRIRHMVEAAQSARSFAAGRSRAELDADVWATLQDDLEPLVASLSRWLDAQ